VRSWLIGSVTGLISVTAMAGAVEQGPPPLDPDLVRTGRMVYQQQCASCHGARGKGAPDWQQPDAKGELPPPPHDAHGHTWKHSDAMLYRIVRNGWRDPFNKTDRLAMPAFAGALSPKEARAVITYLKTLWTPEQRRFQWQESQKGPFPPETNRSAQDSVIGPATDQRK